MATRPAWSLGTAAAPRNKQDWTLTSEEEMKPSSANIEVQDI